MVNMKKNILIICSTLALALITILYGIDSNRETLTAGGNLVKIGEPAPSFSLGSAILKQSAEHRFFYVNCISHCNTLASCNLRGFYENNCILCMLISWNRLILENNCI
jgi:hypothetical protein